MTPPREWRAVPLIGGLWLLAACFLTIRLGGRHAPTVFIDELVYGRLAQNLAAGDGFTYQGNGSSFRTIYPFLIAPSWLAFSGTTAYHVALGLNALVMTAAVMPAYALARRVAGEPLALAAATASVLVPSMVWAGMLMTEALAYPTAALALLAIVRALERPSWGRAAGAVGAIALAAAARGQMLAMFAVFALAVGVEVARNGREFRARLRLQIPNLAVVGAIALSGLTVVLAGRREGLLGTHARFTETAPPVDRLLEVSLDYVGVLALASLVLPFIALLVLGLRRASWGDDALAPLLATAAATSLVLIALGAWFSTTVSEELWERYVFYAAPALIACSVALPGRVGWKPVAATAVLLFLYLLPVIPGTSSTTEWGEDYSLHAADSVRDRLQSVGDAVWMLEPLTDAARSLLDVVQPFALAALVIGLLAALGLSLRSRRWCALALVGPMLAFGTLALNVRMTDANRQSEIWKELHTQPLTWVDDLTDGPVAAVRTPGSDRFAVWHTEVWNQNVDRTWGVEMTETGELGQVCKLELLSDGRLIPPHDCAGRALARYLLFFDPEGRYRVMNGKLLEEGKAGARLYEFPPSETPRIATVEP